MNLIQETKQVFNLFKTNTTKRARIKTTLYSTAKDSRIIRIETIEIDRKGNISLHANTKDEHGYTHILTKENRRQLESYARFKCIKYTEQAGKAYLYFDGARHIILKKGNDIYSKKLIDGVPGIDVQPVNITKTVLNYNVTFFLRNAEKRILADVNGYVPQLSI